MTDIDFDELDRAVNSLMQPKRQSPAASVASSQEAAATSDPVVESTDPVPESSTDLTATSKSVVEPTVMMPDPIDQQPVVPAESPEVAAEPVLSMPDPIDEPVPGLVGQPSPVPSEPNQPVDYEPSQAQAVVDEPTSRASINTKKRGQFMDVMHASSDMKQADTTPKLAPRKPGITLQPSNPAKPVKPAQVSEPVKQPIATSAAKNQTVWPDPIGMTSQNQEKMTVDTNIEQSVPAEPTETATEYASNDSSPSPFISDAKVEKRPLGGLQPTSMVESKPVSDPDMVDRDTGSGSSDVQALPAELRQDILAIETNALAKPDVDKAEPSPPAKPSLPEAVNQSTHPVVESAATPTALSVGSLPQKPPVKTEDDSTRLDSSIFDTEQYQAPIKRPTKRKSGWPAIVAIITLVVLGTGGGIAFYLLSNGY